LKTREQIQNERFKRFFGVSLALHGAFMAASFLGNLVFPGDPEMFVPTVQVDMVALPDLVKSDKEPVLDKTLPVKDEPAPKEKPAEKVAEKEPEKAKPKDEPPKPDEMTLKRERDAAAKKALDRLREEMKKAQKEAEKKKQEDLADKRKENQKRFEEAFRNALKGNQVNEGTSTTGVTEATKNAYVGMIQQTIRNNWGLPAWLQNRGLSAAVVIQIDGRGNVVGFRFLKTSGNDTFDEYVKSAVQQSSPFAAPPEEMARTVRSGVGVRFPL
jgi:TonB family protein